MNIRKLFLSLAALLCSSVFFNAVAQTQEKTEPAKTIVGKWDLTTEETPMGTFAFTMVITQTEDGYKANMDGAPMENVTITDKSIEFTTTNMGFTVDIGIYLTEKDTLIGDAMGVTITGTRAVEKKK